MTPNDWLSILIIVGEGAVVVVFLKVVRTFGAYTVALIETHQSNLRVLEDLSKTRDTNLKKESA